MSAVFGQRANASFRLRAVAVFVLLFALGAEGDVAVGVGGGDVAQGARNGAQSQGGFLYSRWIEGREVYTAADADTARPPQLNSLPLTLPGGKGE